MLSNALNTFGTGGSVINITGGLVSVASDGALGDVANVISLNGGGTGLQLTGSGNYAHQINTTAGGGVLDVTQGITATLTTAFNAAAANANALTKKGNGILDIKRG